jgi:hypothetical protein
MSQAQDAMLGNLPNGIVTTLASHYVTNVMNADPETKLRYGQNAPLGSRPSRLVTCFVYLTLAMDRSRVSFLYAPVDDKPKNSIETIPLATLVVNRFRPQTTRVRFTRGSYLTIQSAPQHVLRTVWQASIQAFQAS